MITWADISTISLGSSSLVSLRSEELTSRVSTLREHLLPPLQVGIRLDPLLYFKCQFFDPHYSVRGRVAPLAGGLKGGATCQS